MNVCNLRCVCGGNDSSQCRMVNMVNYRVQFKVCVGMLVLKCRIVYMVNARIYCLWKCDEIGYVVM